MYITVALFPIRKLADSISTNEEKKKIGCTFLLDMVEKSMSLQQPSSTLTKCSNSLKHLNPPILKI